MKTIMGTIKRLAAVGGLMLYVFIIGSVLIALIADVWPVLLWTAIACFFALAITEE